MWKIKIDHTLEQARLFLLNDFLKVVKRTRYLYVDSKFPNDIGPGYFEPVLLILCWCDFLGALYTGNGSRKGSTERSKIYIREVMGKINPKYEQSAKYMVQNYRNGAVNSEKGRSDLILTSYLYTHHGIQPVSNGYLRTDTSGAE